MSSGVRAIEEAVLEILSETRKPLTLFMLGGVDVGKTHTVTAFANRFHDFGLKIAVVDADVGQSDVGPPCCIGPGILDRKIRKLSEVPLHRLYFVGNTSPSGYTRECVEGTLAAVHEAKKLTAEIIFIDATGWVGGDEAKNFKLFEIHAIDPSLVIAIENEDELELILRRLTQRVIKVRRSRLARGRTREERRALREEAYDTYFSAARDCVFELSLVTWPAEVGQLVGIFSGDERDGSNEELLGLGILRKLDYDREKAVVLTPVDTETGGAEVVKWLKPGGLKLIRVNGRLKEFKSAQYLLSKP